VASSNPNYHRHSIRLPGYDYSQEGAYYITICTYNRQNLFGEIVNNEMILNEYGEIANKYWNEIPKHYTNTQLDEYVIMPNHIHGIIFIVGAIHELPLQQNEFSQLIQRRKMLLPKIIGRFKMNAAKQINQIRQTPGIPVWQRNYYEHIIRDTDDLSRIRHYISDNPKNWNNDEYNINPQ
jgi:REP element-mobilizing transposase RayT